MKILKTILIITLICVLGERNVYSQTTNWDEYYTTTVLYDDFSDGQLDFVFFEPTNVSEHGIAKQPEVVHPKL